jgi:hypothetical protein
MVVTPKTDIGVAGRLHNPSRPPAWGVPGRDDGSEQFTGRRTARKGESTGMIHSLHRAWGKHGETGRSIVRNCDTDWP